MADYVPLRKRLQQLLQVEPTPIAPDLGTGDAPSLSAEDAPIAGATVLASNQDIGSLVQSTRPPDPVEHTILSVPLDQLVIDPHQPRQYLPADLRARAARHEQSAQDVMAALIERAASNDVEATGYLDSLASLAHSIAAVGLLQPIRVSMDTRTDGQLVFQIVDGERRLWASLYLNARNQANDAASPELIRTLPALLSPADATADDLQRAQWAINLQREDIPAVDYAETVWRIREACLARLEADPRQVEALGPDHSGLPLREVAVHLTEREVEHLMGTPVSRAMIYRCGTIAEKLSHPAKAIGRAHNISFRQLMGVVHLPAERQPDALLSIVRARRNRDLGNARLTRETKPASSEKRAGRPTQVQRGITQCVGLVNILGRLNEKHLRAAGPESAQAFLAELDRASREVARWQHLARAMLNR